MVEVVCARAENCLPFCWLFLALLPRRQNWAQVATSIPDDSGRQEWMDMMLRRLFFYESFQSLPFVRREGAEELSLGEDHEWISEEGQDRRSPHATSHRASSYLAWIACLLACLPPSRHVCSVQCLSVRTSTSGSFPSPCRYHSVGRYVK